MGNCCQNKTCELEKLKKSQSKILWIALILNGLMFFTELVGGLVAHSLSLVGDSLDMLGDAVAYASSLYVIHKGARSKALSASLKGVIMIALAGAVLLQAIWKIVTMSEPSVTLMGGITLLALLSNIICLLMLTRHRHDDINMSSIWICSRNDLVANVSMLAAAGLVALTRSPWPDILVGVGIALLFLKSGLSVLQQARKELALEQKTVPMSGQTSTV